MNNSKCVDRSLHHSRLTKKKTRQKKKSVPFLIYSWNYNNRVLIFVSFLVNSLPSMRNMNSVTVRQTVLVIPYVTENLVYAHVCVKAHDVCSVLADIMLRQSSEPHRQRAEWWKETLKIVGLLHRHTRNRKENAFTRNNTHTHTHTHKYDQKYGVQTC